MIPFFIDDDEPPPVGGVHTIHLARTFTVCFDDGVCFRVYPMCDDDARGTTTDRIDFAVSLLQIGAPKTPLCEKCRRQHSIESGLISKDFPFINPGRGGAIAGCDATNSKGDHCALALGHTRGHAFSAAELLPTTPLAEAMKLCPRCSSSETGRLRVAGVPAGPNWSCHACGFLWKPVDGGGSNA